MYPLVELVVALGWLGAVIAYGPGLTALRVAVFGTVLFGVILTDAREYVIPDGFTAFGLVWAFVMAFVAVFVPETSPFATLYDSLIGACASAGAIAIVGWLGELVLKKEAMGFGDVTLMAMVGAHLGVVRGLMTIFLGAALGAVGFLVIVFPVAWLRSKRAGKEFEPPLVPFGVFLAPAAMVALLWGDALLNWYRGLMGI
jgi:Type II secretory pathway, prepilin signal peptidase PulO and related peptidases